MISPKLILSLLITGCVCFAGLSQSHVRAEERVMTEEQQRAIAEADELEEQVESKRPDNLPDLTKGELVKERLPQFEWHLGPTGIIGYMPGNFRGDQIEVTSVLPGSPADGKLQRGDVILGVNGENFEAGGNMAMVFGKAIIESERAVNDGKLTLRVWRDHNFIKRNAAKDIRNRDVDDLIDKAVSDDALYEWRSTEEKKDAVRSSNFRDFPIQAEELEITLDLPVFPDYSDTSPYDCPKAAKILENAWAVLEEQFEEGKVKANRKGTVAALALIASGKPEHRELIEQWVRSPNAKAWHPSIAEKFDINKPAGFMSWRMGFDGLDCAIYYHATGDSFVLPAVEAYAKFTALGQARAGSWGHTFAWPSFNGGELHGMNPGYGALNAAGNRCFMLLALAKNIGIEDPVIDEAIERSSRFFGSYYEKGAIPYGHHGAAASDDSNGKNVGVGFAFKLLGDMERAKWFAQMSSHASFTRRAGHANDYFWHYSPWAATMLGPEVTIATHRNLRWRFTLNRRFDGGFVIQSPIDGITELRNATGTFVLHYAAPFQQTLWTGKNLEDDMRLTDEEFQNLITMAQGQFNDEKLLEQAGPRVKDRSTDEVFEFLDVFKPKARHIYARELARRYTEQNEQDILPRLLELLQSDNPRLREAACHALKACGRDVMLAYLSQIIPLLKDEEEFVRMQAAKAIAIASENTEAQKALLQATIDEDMTESIGPNALPNITQNLFRGDSKLAKSPFETELDNELVEAALEKIIMLDPTGNGAMLSRQNKVWDRDTLLQIAGPIVYTAEEEQIGDQMFSGRRQWSLELLERLGYQEAIDGAVSYLRKFEELPRNVRQNMTYKRGIVDATVIMRHPEAAKQHLDAMKRWLHDKPLDLARKGNKEFTPIQLYEVIHRLEAVEEARPKVSLADRVRRDFIQRLNSLDDQAAQVAMCRAELVDPARRNLFRKVAALDWLAEHLGPDANGDVLAYLGHDHWRVRDQAHASAVKLAKANGEAFLIEAFSNANDAQAVAILDVLSDTKTEAGRQLAQQALEHDSPLVRGAAIKTLVAISGTQAMDQVFAMMQDAEHLAVLHAAEDALLSRRDDPNWMDQVRSRAIAMLPKAKPLTRESMLWLIGQAGGDESLAVLKEMAYTQDDQKFHEVINALAYSPDAEADALVLSIIEQNRDDPRGKQAASHSVRRMVSSPDGPGHRSVDEQLDYAERLLNLVIDPATITYLGRIHTGRSANILQRTMKRGEPAAAAKAIIAATANLQDAPAADRKQAEEALINTIEFIEVTQLRGGATERDWRTYPMWKAISAEAGKNLLKLDKAEKAPPPPAFDDLDLGL